MLHIAFRRGGSGHPEKTVPAPGFHATGPGAD